MLLQTRAPHVLLLATVAALVVGCGGQPAAGPSGTPTASVPSSDVATTPAGTLTGRLEGDAQLEGGCAWLVVTGGADADIGDQVMPLFPDGYQVEFEPEVRLVGPDGEAVATAGQELVVEGAPAEAMATTCQVGPPYRVDEVRVAGGGG